MAELQAVPFSDFVHPDDLEPTGEAYAAQVKQGRESIAFENRYRCKDGSYRWLAWNSVPVAGRDIVVANARDVTERRRQAAELDRHRQELERSNAELARFAYVVSHDLQAPLRTIRNSLEIIQKDLGAQLAANEEVSGHFARVMAASQRLQRMIRDMLTYSRAGRTAGKPRARDATDPDLRRTPAARRMGVRGPGQRHGDGSE